MTEPREVIDDKFDDESDTVPPAPSRPAGQPGRSIAETIDRTGIALFLENLERGASFERRLRVEEAAVTNRRIELLTAEVRDGFKMFGERILPTLERIERVLTDHNTRLVESEQRTRTLEDRMHDHDKQLAEHAVRLDRLETAAAKRLKRK